MPLEIGVHNPIIRRQIGAAPPASGAQLTETFTYDKLNRLTGSEVLGQPIKSYGYDDLGNLKSRTSSALSVNRQVWVTLDLDDDLMVVVPANSTAASTPASSLTYNYPASGASSVRPHAVSSLTGTLAGLTNPVFTYDANGNLTLGLNRGYAWSAANLPTQIDKLSNGLLSSASERTEFLYGPDRQRLRQSVRAMAGTTPGAVKRTIHYGGAIEKEVDFVANKTEIRTYLPEGLGYTLEPISGSAVAPTATGTFSARFLHGDHLGSPIAISMATQAVAQRMSYDAWGRRRNPDGSDDSWTGLGTLKNDQDNTGYTGQEQLDQLGLVHLNGRVYDPMMGRMTSADPTVPDPLNLQSLNRFTYVLNNGLAFVDPTGFAPEVPTQAEPFGAVQRVEILGARLPPEPVVVPPSVGVGTGRIVFAPTGGIGFAGVVAFAASNAQRQAPALARAFAREARSAVNGAKIAAQKLRDALLGTPLGDFLALGAGIMQAASDALGGDQGDGVPSADGGANSEEGCIYCVPGDKTSSGKDYIGSTDNMGNRQRDKSDGRDREGAEVVDTYPKGDREARRVKEQQAMNDRGGVDKLDNKRNEVAPKKWPSMGVTPP